MIFRKIKEELSYLSNVCHSNKERLGGIKNSKFARMKTYKVDIAGGRQIDHVDVISLEERIYLIEEKLGMYNDGGE